MPTDSRQSEPLPAEAANPETPSQASADPMLEAAPQQEGTVKWYSLAKGYGFVEPQGAADDVFIHHTELVGGEDLREGDRVRFRLVDTPRGLSGRRVERLVDSKAS